MSSDLKLCECGCGYPAPIAKRKSNGFRKGEVQRFLLGHNNRLRRLPVPYIVEPLTGCWIWQGYKSKKGYGQMSITRGGKKKSVYAHRYFYEQHRGPIPSGRDLDHLCHNTICVNPQRLEAVSERVNCRRGNRTRFTADQIEEIRRLWDTGTFKQYELAERFQTTQANIHWIVSRKNWRSDGERRANVGRLKGHLHKMAKLTEDIVREAIQRHRNGETCAVLAKEYGVSISSINYAVRGKTWKHVHGAAA